MDSVQIISFLVGFAIFIAVILLIRSGRLKERYALLWLFSTLVICLLSISRTLLETVSHSFGIYYAPSFIFLVGVLFLLVINISFSVTISELARKVDLLAQEIALMKEEQKSARKGAP